MDRSGSCRGVHRCDGGSVLVRGASSRSEERPMTKTHRVYTCGVCGRKLKPEHYIYSSATGARYCWPGEGCDRRRRAQKARKANAALVADVEELELEGSGHTSLGIPGEQ